MIPFHIPLSFTQHQNKTESLQLHFLALKTRKSKKMKVVGFISWNNDWKSLNIHVIIESQFIHFFNTSACFREKLCAKQSFLPARSCIFQTIIRESFAKLFKQANTNRILLDSSIDLLVNVIFHLCRELDIC